MKSNRLFFTAAALSVLLTTTSFAGTWQNGTGADQGKMWYDNGSGAWVQNGVIQTRAVNANVEPISETDFVVSGDNSVTRSNADNSIISNWKRVLGDTNDPMIYHAFVTGDSLTTARGISLGDSKADVMAKYGSAEVQSFHAPADKWYQIMVANGNGEVSVIVSSTSVIEYYTNPYGIRFYFDQQDNIIGVVYFRDLSAGNPDSNPQEQGGINPVNYKGDYSYSSGSSFILNEQTGNYDLFATTSDNSEEEWERKIYPASVERTVTISDAASQSFVMESWGTAYTFLQQGEKWICDANNDGTLQESEMNDGNYMTLLEDGRICAHTVMSINYENEYYGWPMNSTLMTVVYYTKNN